MLLNEIDGVTTVHARFYELSSNYYRTIGNHCEYYKNALRYLGCIKVENIPSKPTRPPRSDSQFKSRCLRSLLLTRQANVQQEQAFFLSLAALLGDGIYNFGELVILISAF